MIELYSGTPGSGKSLRAATLIYWRLRRSLPVIANFSIDTSKIKKVWRKQPTFFEVDNDTITPSNLVEFAHDYWAQKGGRVKEDEIVLIIDEAQLIFNARDWQATGRKEWLSFFSQHRKFGYKIILIAQYDNMLDKQIRCLIEYEWVHRKLSNFGWRGKLLSLFYGGNTFVAVRIWYPLKERVDSEIFHSRKKYYQIYDTYKSFDQKK